MSTINTIDFESKLTNELDKAIVQKSVTSFMADNSFRQKFVGARTVLVPDVDFSGLGDYDRDGGFTTGAVNVNQESYQLTQDRARSFSIDREDMDETGIAGLAGAGRTEVLECLFGIAAREKGKDPFIIILDKIERLDFSRWR